MRSDRLRLLDILDAIDVVAKYLPEDRKKFDDDPPLQSHIYRHVMMVGEAAWALSDKIKQQNPGVPWKQIAGMRHVMIISKWIGTLCSTQQESIYRHYDPRLH